MNSFSIYTQSNNCNLVLKKSLVFTLYNNKVKTKDLYYKTNNNIKGFYKDAILNDFVYFASNGIKKNAIFRKNEIKTNNRSFVSYFNRIEDNFCVFNIYPQKHFSDTVKNYANNQELIYNLKQKNTTQRTIDSLFLNNYRILQTSNSKPFRFKHTKQLFIKNYYDKNYFVNDNGFIKEFNNKSFPKNLFSGLLYILPMDVHKQIKNLFSMNYLLLNFFNSINSKSLTSITLKSNIIIYTFFLKYINQTISSYFNENKIKTRRSNWLLFKYVKIYSKPLNKFINFFYNFSLKRIQSFNWMDELDKILNSRKIMIKTSYALISKNLRAISQNDKVKLIKYILMKIFANYNNFNIYITNDNTLYKYIGYKLLLLANYKQFKLGYIPTKSSSTNLNYLCLLNNQIINIYPNAYLSNSNILYNSIINWNITQKTASFYLNREFLNLKSTKNYTSFNRNLTTNKYALAFSFKEINNFKQNIFRLKRFISKKKRNIKNNNKIAMSPILKLKSLKLKKIKNPLLRFYNLINFKKINSVKYDNNK